MWKYLLMLCILGIVILPSGVSADNLTSVNLVLGEGNTPQEFRVNIAISPSTPIAGCQMDISFDPTLVSVSEVVKGEVLNSVGMNCLFASGTIDNIQGKVTNIFGTVLTKDLEITESGILATIVFLTNGKEGSCLITPTNVVVGTSGGTPLSLSLSGIRVNLKGTVDKVIDAVSTKEEIVLVSNVEVPKEGEEILPDIEDTTEDPIKKSSPSSAFGEIFPYLIAGLLIVIGLSAAYLLLSGG